MKRTLLLSALTGLLLFLNTINATAQDQNAFGVYKVTFSGDNGIVGYFETTDGLNWKEGNKTSGDQYSFVETKRDYWSVYLKDNSRNIAIEIDLFRSKIILDYNGPGRKDLYDITEKNMKGTINEGAAFQVDTAAWYRLTTQFQGDQKSLDVQNDGMNNNQPWLTSSANVSGQYWKFTPVVNGYYRITCQWLGSSKSLDILNDGKNNKPIMMNSADYSGQLWKLTDLKNGYFRLTTQFQGDQKSLDVINDGINNKLTLGPTEDVSGQLWKLTKL